VNTYWSPNDIASMGGFSLALTLVNIACIWVFAALMFWVKEVAPLPNKSELWTTLVPEARKFNVAVLRGKIKSDALEQEIKSMEASRGAENPKIGKGGLRTQRPPGFVAYGTQNRAELRRKTNANRIFQNLVSVFSDPQDDEEARGGMVV
jgi:hypothetical protein